MSAWKTSLGGLIRLYVHKRTTCPHQSMVDQKTAEEEIDQMYYRAGCSLEDTKGAILEALGVKDGEEWIRIGMAIERDESMADNPTDAKANLGDEMDDSVESKAYKETIDNKGIILHQTLRPGEGPAHSTEQWTTVLVPQWAIGKSYYFQVTNNSPLDLSCELFLDGEQVAFNAPLSANSTRTIRPDGVRYYMRHQWILNEAKMVKLGSGEGAPAKNVEQVQKPATQRYNGQRPDYEGLCVSLQDYQDPTAHGWKFTGSVQAARVEFYEKKMNDGGVVKVVLDGLLCLPVLGNPSDSFSSFS
jgi:hypothetical protein